jgi:hypothetical protein
VIELIERQRKREWLSKKEGEEDREIESERERG